MQPTRCLSTSPTLFLLLLLALLAHLHTSASTTPTLTTTARANDAFAAAGTRGGGDHLLSSSSLHSPSLSPPPPAHRFIVAFRTYADRKAHEQWFEEKWLEVAAHAAEQHDAHMVESAVADDVTSLSPSAAFNSSRCAAAAHPSPPLHWHFVTRSNPAATLPTDFIVVQFEAAADELLCPPAGRSLAQQRAVHRRALTRLQQLQRTHSDQLKYVVEDAQLSRSLMFHDEEEEEQGEEEGDEWVEMESAARAAAANFTPPLRFNLARAVDEGGSDSNGQNGVSQSPGVSRKLCQWGSMHANSVTDILRAAHLWDRGYKGSGIRIAIFDTGLSSTHPHFRHIDERTNWTDEQQLDDRLGHGTFVAGVIASAAECLGFAPEASLHIYRVFNQRQLSFTSWFLDAFNYAIHAGVHILNLSIGGPDFMDRPFVDKVNELTANGVTMVSAIGNDGPLWGTLNNPADQLDVIGVGGINEDDRISPFSSRGMTTWELPHGYGRMKPDLVALARNLRGSAPGRGCKTMSGTSVASPVVAGCVTLLASVIPEHERARKLNLAFLKQLLLESAQRLGSPANAARDETPGMFEQGVGKIALLQAFELLTNTERPFEPHASMVPAKLDLTDCPYMWPYCTQPLYHTALPIIVNATLLNSQSVSSFVAPDSPPVFHAATEAAARYLRVSFTYPDTFWPWSGYFAFHLSLTEDVPAALVLEGFVELTIQTDDEFALRSRIKVPLRVAAMPTPPRHKRILFDAFHNLRYPSGYFPRDNLEVKSDTLDWNGDHVHTNYRELYTLLRQHDYVVEVLGTDWTCVNATHYGALFLIDPEEEYFAEERQKLYEDVYADGLSVFIMAEWYHQQVMREIKFYDENTAQWWTPETGGANLPALNTLLAGFGIQLTDHVVKGDIKISDEAFYYASGTTIGRMPQGAYLASYFLSDGGSGAPSRDYAVMGAYAPAAAASPLAPSYPTAGRLFIYGDSNCVDMNHRRGALCANMVLDALHFLHTGTPPPRLFAPAQLLSSPYHDATSLRKPRRMLGNNLIKYSKVVAPGSAPACPLFNAPHAAGDNNTDDSAAATHVNFVDLHRQLFDEATPQAQPVSASPVKSSARFNAAIKKELQKQQQQKRRKQRRAMPAAADAAQLPIDAVAASSPAGATGSALASAGDSNHVLSKKTRLGPAAHDLVASELAAEETARLFAGDGPGRQAAAAIEEAHRRVARIALAVIVAAILLVAWVYRNARRAQMAAAAAGKHSPVNTPQLASRTLLPQPMPQRTMQPLTATRQV